MKKGSKHTPETRAKMSAAMKGKTYGPHTPETRAKMSAAKMGKPLSDEHKAAMRAAQVRRVSTIPPELYDDYMLYRRKRFSAAEARAALGLPGPNAR